MMHLSDMALRAWVAVETWRATSQVGEERGQAVVQQALVMAPWPVVIFTILATIRK